VLGRVGVLGVQEGEVEEGVTECGMLRGHEQGR
jgi:hypothetical protein